jgi:hypothetical protein
MPCPLLADCVAKVPVCRAMSRLFGDRLPVDERFAAAVSSSPGTGALLLADRAAAFDGRIIDVADVGTHDVLLPDRAMHAKRAGGLMSSATLQIKVLPKRMLERGCSPLRALGYGRMNSQARRHTRPGASILRKAVGALVDDLGEIDFEARGVHRAALFRATCPIRAPGGLSI